MTRNILHEHIIFFQSTFSVQAENFNISTLLISQQKYCINTQKIEISLMKCLYICNTYFFNLLSTEGSGVPKTSWILAIWSTSFEPGNNGCKLKLNI